MSAALLSDNIPIVAQDMDFILAACQPELAQLAGQRVLITGGSGFIGSYLVESVLVWNRQQPQQAISLLLPTRSVAAVRQRRPDLCGHPGIDWVEWADITTGNTGQPCWFVVHAASPADPAAYRKAPMQAMQAIADATVKVLDFAHRQQAKSILYLSSGAVYGAQPPDMAAMPEDYPGAPDVNDASACYGEAKRYAELLCVCSGLPVVRARLFAFLGPTQDPDASFAVPDFLRQATETKVIKIKGDGRAWRSYCYASDLTICLLKLLCHGAAGSVINIGGEQPVTTLELAQRVAELVGGVTVEVQGRQDAAQSAARYIPDITRLKRIYTPQIKLPEALRRVLAAREASQ